MTPTPARSPWARSRWPWALVAIAALLLVWRLEGGGGAAGARDEHRGLAGRGSDRTADGDRSQLPGRVWQPRVRGAGPARIAGLIRVSGRVVDATTGAAVGDVEVVFADGKSEASATTDLGGRYTIDVPAGRYRPFVRAEGIVSVGRPERERLPTRPRAEQVAASTLALAPELAVFHDLTGADLEVVRSAVVRGRVFDRAGRPIAGAVVRARPIENDGGQPVLGTDVAETDLDGTFRLEIAARTHQLEAFHDDYGASETRPLVELEPGQTLDIDLTMIAGCIIAGRVVGDGIPGGDGAIERSWSDDDPTAFGPAGNFAADGTFRWTTDEAVRVTLRAWPWKSAPSAARTFDCHDGARYTDVVFEVPRTASDLSGKVVTAGGGPAAMAFVDVTGLSPGTMNQQERTDADGQWEVFALPPGDYQVTVRVAGGGMATARVSSPSRGNVLTLSGTGSMIGQAKGISDGTFALEADCLDEAPSYGESGERFLVTVESGSYRVDGLPACHANLVVRNGQARVRVLAVDVPAGGVVNQDLDLAPPVSKQVSGRVLDEAGQPVAGAVVAVVEEDGARTTADASGRFTIEARSGATIIVAGEHGSAELYVPDDDTTRWDVDVRLERPVYYEE